MASGGRASSRLQESHARLEAGSLSFVLAFVCFVRLEVDVGFRFVLLSLRCARGGAPVFLWRCSRTGGCSRALLESKCAARVRHRAL